MVYLVFESSWILFSLNLPNGIYSTSPLAFSRICCQPWLFKITVAFFPYAVIFFSRYFWYRIKAWKHIHKVGTFQKEVWVFTEKWDERQRCIRTQTCQAFRIKCRSSVSCCGMWGNFRFLFQPVIEHVKSVSVKMKNHEILQSIQWTLLFCHRFSMQMIFILLVLVFSTGI